MKRFVGWLAVLVVCLVILTKTIVDVIQESVPVGWMFCITLVLSVVGAILSMCMVLDSAVRATTKPRPT